MSNNNTPVIVTRDITFAMTAMGLAHEAGLFYSIIRSAPPEKEISEKLQRDMGEHSPMLASMLASMAKHMIAVFVDDLPDREGFVRAVKKKHDELHATAKGVKEYEESKAAATASEELAKILRAHG